ncbi:hypothetical protein BH10ACI2_BH10ACI2_03450 [soil metagenome]
MAEQSAAYTSLQSQTTHLISALTRCEPATIESLSRAGETELFRMRSRLLEITSALTEFGQVRAGQTEPVPLDPATRENFETQANKLLDSARNYEKTAGRAASLALGGSSFAAANIQMCGVPPSTYRAPVLKYSKGASA